MRAAAVVALLAAGCLRQVGFHCATDGECTQGGVPGVCESVGYCSFPNAGCSSGRQFDGLGGPYANQCTGEIAIDGGLADGRGADAVVRVPPPSGAALWLKLDDDPSDGVADSAGAHAVSCAGTCPTLTAGTVGSAYRFQMTQLTSASTVDLQPNTGFTVSAWARLDSIPTTSYADIVCKQQGSTDASYCLTFRTNLRMDFYTQGPRDLDAPAPTALGAWHHYAMTWDGAVKHGYVDGQEVATAPLTAIAADSGPLVLGAAQTPTTYFINGAIDDVFFYDRALSTIEVGQLMNHL